MAEHKTLAEALAAFQTELPKLRKDEKAKIQGTTKDGRAFDKSYEYAGLDQVSEQINPVLGRHGMSFTSRNLWNEHGVYVLEATLLHESGEMLSGYWPLPDPLRVGPKDLGSAMTYARRYLQMALTGTFPGGEDDDGDKAQQSAQRESWDSAQPTRQQAVEVAAAPKTEWTDAEIREMHGRIDTLEIGKAVNGYDWMAAHNLHTRKIPILTDEPGEPVLINATEALTYRIADLAAKPGATLRDIAILRAYAEDRGLLKVMASESTYLDEELGMAYDVAKKAVEQAQADTPDPQSA
jgi:hypothetical protein